MPCERCVRRRVPCTMPEPSSRRSKPSSPAHGHSLELLLISLAKEHERESLPSSLIHKVRSATTTSGLSWHPEDPPVLPMFPLHGGPNTLGYLNIPMGGDVFTEETDTGYLPVIPRLTLDVMWSGRRPHEVVASTTDCLQLLVFYLIFLVS